MFVGIDVSKKSLDVFVRPKSLRFSVVNDGAGHTTLVEKLRQLGPARDVVVVFESTGAYERDAARAVMEADFDVAVANPARVRDFAKATGHLAKTDTIDAEVIAHFAEVVKPRLLTRTDEETRFAEELLVRRRQLMSMRTEEKTREQQATRATREGIRRHIQWINAELKDVDKDIDTFLRDRLEEKLKLLDTIPGLGPVTKRTLLLEMPELGTMTRREAAALAGLAPFNVDSGEKRGQRHIRGGRVTVRNTLYMVALSAAKTKGIFGDLYRRLIARGKPAKVALTAVARKVLVIANGVLRTKSPWMGSPPAT